MLSPTRPSWSLNWENNAKYSFSVKHHGPVADTLSLPADRLFWFLWPFSVPRIDSTVVIFSFLLNLTLHTYPAIRRSQKCRLLLRNQLGFRPKQLVTYRHSMVKTPVLFRWPQLNNSVSGWYLWVIVWESHYIFSDCCPSEFNSHTSIQTQLFRKGQVARWDRALTCNNGPYSKNVRPSAKATTPLPSAHPQT